MRKLLIFLFSTSVLMIAPSNIIACNPSINNQDELIIAPDWVYTMIKKDPNQINIGYDHYLLLNKINDKDPFNQKDRLDLDLNKNLYLYLPDADNIDEAIKQIKINDTANPAFTIGIQEPITWAKINNTTYTNNNFITEDTSVSGVALMDNIKYKQIKESNITNIWTSEEKKLFDDFATLPARIDPNSKRKNQNWWNGNGWEKLLSDKKNLSSTKAEDQGKKFSQQDLYNRWIDQKTIGMNVPLSLIEKNSFTLKTTQINHVFLFSAFPTQTWIDNNSNLINIVTPHWGFSLKIINHEETIFHTPNFVHLHNTYKEDKIKDYLLKKDFLTFNSLEATKFKDNYLN